MITSTTTTRAQINFFTSSSSPRVEEEVITSSVAMAARPVSRGCPVGPVPSRRFVEVTSALPVRGEEEAHLARRGET